jgi:phage gp29-like protein
MAPTRKNKTTTSAPAVKTKPKGEGLPQVLVSEIPPVSVSDHLNLGAVKTALSQLEDGKFQAAADLVEAMWRDDRIPGVVETRVEALHGLELRFDPPEGEEKNAQAIEIGELAERSWPTWLPEEVASDLRRWGLMLNLGIGRVRWDTSGETWEPRVEVFHPRNARWSSLEGGYRIATQEGEWLIQRDERGIVAKAPDGTEERNGWMVYTPFGWKRGWMRALVRSLSILWLFRQWALRDWSSHSEAHGTPSKKAFVPNGTKVPDKRKFLRDVALLVRRSAILLERGTENGQEKKPGFDVELLEAAADSHQVFEKLKAACDTDIAIRVKGQNLTTEVKGGAYAATQSHREIDGEKLRFDAATLGTCAHDQLVAPWTEFNFAARELAPWPKWDTEPTEDLKVAAEALDKLGDATQKLWNSGYPLDLGKMAERFDVPVQEGAEMPTEPPAPKVVAVPAPGSPPPRGGGAAARALAGMVAVAGLPIGAIEGQTYADDLVEEHGAAGVAALKPDVDQLLGIVKASASWEDLRARLVEAYGDMKPEKLQGVVRDALILAELNGRLSASEDE